MTREARLAETFVELADTLVAEFEVIDFLHTLAYRIVEFIDADAVGIMLADQSGSPGSCVNGCVVSGSHAKLAAKSLSTSVERLDSPLWTILGCLSLRCDPSEERCHYLA